MVSAVVCVGLAGGLWVRGGVCGAVGWAVVSRRSVWGWRMDRGAPTVPARRTDRDAPGGPPRLASWNTAGHGPPPG